MATPSKKRLALAIIDFLQTSLTDGTLTSEDTESIEIAQNCIAESFKVDPTDKAAMADALGGQNLLSIYGVYERLKGKGATGPQAGGSGSSSASAAESGPTAGTSGGTTTTKEKQAEAETLKSRGNAAMQRKEYDEAISCYTKALELNPLNPIYLSNRAAAYSATQQHELAKNDAEMAVAADPKYTKAWSRLGLAKFALGDARGSMEAYKQGIDAEGSGGSEAMKKGYETAKRRVEEEGGAGGDPLDEDSSTTARGPSPGAGGMPDLASLASMFGGGGAPGGGGGGGGMPDLSQIMNNPMMRQMAQSVMSNPDMMNSLMNNPRLREMAERFGGAGRGGGGAGAGAGAGGGGMPDLASLMQDPSLAEMARNMMGGGGRGAGP